MALTAVKSHRAVVIRGYWTVALHPFRCEGTNPLASKPTFAENHRDIARGERFLRKSWETVEGIEFQARHCRACAVAMGVRDGE